MMMMMMTVMVGLVAARDMCATKRKPCGDHSTCRSDIPKYICMCDPGYDGVNGLNCTGQSGSL